MVATPSRTQSITPNMNKRIAQPHSQKLEREMSSSSIVTKHRKLVGRSIGGQCYNRITSHLIAGKMEPPTTRKDIIIRFRNVSVGMNNTCSSCSPTSSMLILLICFSKWNGHPLRYTGINDGVTLRGQGTHENGGKHTRERKNGSTDKTKI